MNSSSDPNRAAGLIQAAIEAVRSRHPNERYPMVAREAALHLRVHDRRSVEEIVKVLGVPKGTAFSWVSHLPLNPAEKKARAQRNARSREGCRWPKTKALQAAEKSKYYQMTGGRVLGRAEKCRIAEAAIAFRLPLHKLDQYRSPFGGDAIDFVVVCPSGMLAKVQVRWLRWTNSGAPCLNIIRSAGKRERYTPRHADFIIGYDLENDNAYVYALSEVLRNKRGIAVTKEAKERWDKIVRFGTASNN